jgi:hypothetical protein
MSRFYTKNSSFSTKSYQAEICQLLITHLLAKGIKTAFGRKKTPFCIIGMRQLRDLLALENESAGPINNSF